MNYLDLSFNNFREIEVPKFLGSLHRLRYLNLSNANLGGIIPQTIGNLSRLCYLDLSSYTFEQVKNNLQWLSGLHSLEHLNLGMIDLTETADQWLQEVNMLSSLHELHLPQCGLSAIPFFLPHVNFSSLSVLNLANNGFNSSIPQWLFNLTKLSYLDLSSNNLQGTIPFAFANLTSLQTLDLSENYLLGGELSKNLANLCNLQKLDLSVNNFSGQITELIDGFSICPGSKLEILNLGYNIELGRKNSGFNRTLEKPQISCTMGKFVYRFPTRFHWKPVIFRGIVPHEHQNEWNSSRKHGKFVVIDCPRHV